MKSYNEEERNKICKDYNWFGGFFPDRLPKRISFECDDGWLPLIRELCKKLKEAGFNGNVVQCKEKFGTLRFYADFTENEHESIIDTYERKSAITCEVCGEVGEGRNLGYWIKTLCDKHYKEWEDKRNNSHCILEMKNDNKW